MSWIYANKIVTTMVRTMSTIERISKSLTNGKVTILVNVRKPKKREQEYIDNLPVGEDDNSDSTLNDED